MRELTKREIEEKEEYIKTLRGKEEYKFYFSDESLNMPVRAWMDGGYYIDLTEYAGTFFFRCYKAARRGEQLWSGGTYKTACRRIRRTLFVVLQRK